MGPAHPIQPRPAVADRRDDGLHGTRLIVQDGLDEAVQSLFSAADVPLVRADELRAAVTGPALKSVLEIRIEQMVKHGHTLELDLDLPLGWLVNDALQRLRAALDVINGGPDRRNLKVARRRVATAAALLLAGIDVLDATITAEEG
jgi:hypothetical protein